VFRGEVSQRAAQDVKSLSAHMQPLVVQALLTTFQRSLREELRAWLKEPEESAKAPESEEG
jgi:hypothetical protein